MVPLGYYCEATLLCSEGGGHATITFLTKGDLLGSPSANICRPLPLNNPEVEIP